MKLGADVIELDVRGRRTARSSWMHDATVDGRPTEADEQRNDARSGKKLDAGYRFSPDAGKTFPFRAKEIRVPTLQKFSRLSPKQNSSSNQNRKRLRWLILYCGLIRERKMTDKVVVGSFSQTILDDFRRQCTEVATSAARRDDQISGNV